MPVTVYHKINDSIQPIKDHILVINMERGDKITSGGIIVLDDNGKDRGIRSRWAQVWKIGPDNRDGLKIGDWVLIEHGRWTYGIETTSSDSDETLYVQRVDNSAILMVSDECPI